MCLELASVPKLLPPKYIRYFFQIQMSYAFSCSHFSVYFDAWSWSSLSHSLFNRLNQIWKALLEKSHLLSLLPVYIVENIKQWNLLPVSGGVFCQVTFSHPSSPVLLSK